MQFWSLGQEDPLEKGMATHSSILAWRVPWTEEPGGLQFIGSQRVGHNRSDLACMPTRYPDNTGRLWPLGLKYKIMGCSNPFFKGTPSHNSKHNHFSSFTVTIAISTSTGVTTDGSPALHQPGTQHFKCCIFLRALRQVCLLWSKTVICVGHTGIKARIVIDNQPRALVFPELAAHLQAWRAHCLIPVLTVQRTPTGLHSPNFFKFSPRSIFKIKKLGETREGLLAFHS